MTEERDPRDLCSTRKTSKRHMVGYKNPPTHTRWQKGQSGNKAGRPRKKKESLQEVVWDELNKKVKVQEGGKVREIYKLEALGKKLVNDALNGDKKSIEYVKAMTKEIFDAKMVIEGPQGGVLLVGLRGEASPAAKARGLTLEQELEEQQAPHRSKTVIPPKKNP